MRAGSENLRDQAVEHRTIRLAQTTINIATDRVARSAITSYR
jgi:hypothetical protein